MGSKKNFSKNWHVVGEEATDAIFDFLDNGKLLKNVNCTTATLIPKVTNPNYVIEACLLHHWFFYSLLKSLTGKLKEVDYLHGAFPICIYRR